MKALSLKELALELGDIIVCESGNSTLFTHGVKYEVEQAEDGKLGVITDCGFLATTSASLFTKITCTHSDNKPSSGALNEWPVHDVKRVKLPRVGNTIQCIGHGINVGKSLMRINLHQAMTHQSHVPRVPLQESVTRH